MVLDGSVRVVGVRVLGGGCEGMMVGVRVLDGGV